MNAKMKTVPEIMELYEFWKRVWEDMQTWTIPVGSQDEAYMCLVKQRVDTLAIVLGLNEK